MTFLKSTNTKLVAVTSAFLGLRDDRPYEYYTAPLTDYLGLASPAELGMDIRIYTQPEYAELLNGIKCAAIVGASPEALAKSIWLQEDALAVYDALIRRNWVLRRTSVGHNPRLIFAYLSKIAIIKEAFEGGAEVVFWFDAGHWISCWFDHDSSRYDPAIMNGVSFTGLSDRIVAAAEKYGVVGTIGHDRRVGPLPQTFVALARSIGRSPRGGGLTSIPDRILHRLTRWETRRCGFHMPLHWMYSYAPELGLQLPGPLYTGAFWVVHRRAAQSFLGGFSSWWNRLIDNHKAGTEENALTLLAWQEQYRGLHYLEWLEVLRGSDIAPMGFNEDKIADKRA